MGYCVLAWGASCGPFVGPSAHRPPALDGHTPATAHIRDDIIMRRTDYWKARGEAKVLMFMLPEEVRNGQDQGGSTPSWLQVLGIMSAPVFGVTASLGFFFLDALIELFTGEETGTYYYDEILPVDYGMRWSGELDPQQPVADRIWKCGEGQVLKFLDVNRQQEEVCQKRRVHAMPLDTYYKTWYPTDRFQCVDFDFSGMEHKMGVEVETPCMQNSDNWCVSAFAQGVAYCNFASSYENMLDYSAFRCGTGACCIQGYNNLLGCHGAYSIGPSYKCTPSVKFMLCECANAPPRHSVSPESIAIPCTLCGAGEELSTFCSVRTPGACTACADGKYKADVDTERLYGVCELCEAGTYSNAFTGRTVCRDCGVGTYQDEAGQGLCKACKACFVQELHEVSVCSAPKQTDDACVCVPGFWRKFASCVLVERNTYKPLPGDKNVLNCPVSNNGVPLETVGEGSVDLSQCVCPQNMLRKNATDDAGRDIFFCDQCPPQTPWRRLEWPDLASSCRACEVWEYWNGRDCVLLSRLYIASVPGTSFAVEGGDLMRRREWQYMNKPFALSPGEYLYITHGDSEADADANNTRRECATCSEFAERQGCGSMPQYPMWLSLQYAGFAVERALEKALTADDEDIGFWTEQARNVSIIREGRCVRCAECGAGRYQAECASTATCRTCEPDDICSASEYRQHSTPARFVDGEWRGACEQTPNTAQEPYRCAACARWRERDGVYELLLGCGQEAAYTRWHPTDVAGNALVALTCAYGNHGGSDPLCLLPNEARQPETSDVVPFTHAIPYCAPGWYVDVSAAGCGLEAGAEGLAWDAACCRKCGDAAQAQKIRAAEYKRCTGDSGYDTERYVDRCENNYYRRRQEEGEECALCTTCGL